MTKLIAGLGLSAALAFAAPTTAEAQAGGPIFTGGLVNLTITNVGNNNEIVKDVNVALGVALQLAANVCDVTVNVLAVQLRNTDGPVTCTNGAQTATISPTQQ